MDEYPDKLITEKNLNKFISPVIRRKGKQIQDNQYPIANEDIDTLSVCDHGTISADELMLMDTLGTLVTHGVYNNDSKIGIDFSKRIPKSSDHFVQQKSANSIPPIMLPHLIHRFNKQDKCIIPEFYYKMHKKSLILEDGITYIMQPPVSLKFNDLDLFKKLPILKKKIKTSKKLYDLIKNTADCKIKMNFPITLFGDGRYQKYHFANYCSSNLFRFRILSSEKSSNGNILSRKYQIVFNTILGFFFIQNVLSCYTNLLPGHFYNMTEYAQLFYRMLILPYYNGVKIPISLKEIKARLVLKSDNSMSRKTVKRILKELESNHFISNPDEIQKKDGSYWYQYKKNDWKTITGGT